MEAWQSPHPAASLQQELKVNIFSGLTSGVLVTMIWVEAVYLGRSRIRCCPREEACNRVLPRDLLLQPATPFVRQLSPRRRSLPARGSIYNEAGTYSAIRSPVSVNPPSI